MHAIAEGATILGLQDDQIAKAAIEATNAEYLLQRALAMDTATPETEMQLRSAMAAVDLMYQRYATAPVVRWYIAARQRLHDHAVAVFGSAHGGLIIHIAWQPLTR